MKVGVTVALLLLSLTTTWAKEPELKTSPLAQAFGAAPAMWGAKLSPDGSKVSFLRMHEQGATVAVVLDMVTGKARVVLGGDRDRFDITWCDWANNERLLCGLRGVVLNPPSAYVVTRLAAVNSDSSNMKVLLDFRLRDIPTQFQDRVIDWLPDDDRHVLIQLRSEEGTGVSRLDVYAGDLVTEEHPRGSTYRWIADGHGVPRLYHVVTDLERRWDVRERPEQNSAWSKLHGARLEDADDTFLPIGFTENRNELVYFDRHEGRMALFGMDLANGGQTRLIYAHPTVDVVSASSFGKYRRLVTASYLTDRAHLVFLDRRVADIAALLSRTQPDKQVSVFDEDWAQRYYLVHIRSDQDPGTYYRFDAERHELAAISSAYPTLKGRQLSPMREIHYPTKDGTTVEAYLTLPAGDESGHRPTVILPRGGPLARDYASDNFLVQFLVASGYSVLQSNYRGSEGYSGDWESASGLRNWRVAISDIVDGAEYVVREGIADADRICVVGWSYGGHAALMSAIEQPQRFRCVVSIAGVTDPLELGFNSRRFISGRTEQVAIGVGDEIKGGSPTARATELAVPVLLAHGQRDINVPFAQSQSLARNLTRAKKDVQFIEYEFAQHDIEPERYRIDLLTRVGEFLGQHLGAR